MVASWPKHESFNTHDDSRIAHPPATQSPLKENAHRTTHNKDAQYYLRLYRQLEYHLLHTSSELHDYAIQGSSDMRAINAHINPHSTRTILSNTNLHQLEHTWNNPAPIPTHPIPILALDDEEHLASHLA